MIEGCSFVIESEESINATVKILYLVDGVNIFSSSITYPPEAIQRGREYPDALVGYYPVKCILEMGPRTSIPAWMLSLCTIHTIA